MDVDTNSIRAIFGDEGQLTICVQRRRYPYPVRDGGGVTIHTVV